MIDTYRRGVYIITSLLRSFEFIPILSQDKFFRYFKEDGMCFSKDNLALNILKKILGIFFLKKICQH